MSTDTTPEPEPRIAEWVDEHGWIHRRMHREPAATPEPANLAAAGSTPAAPDLDAVERRAEAAHQHVVKLCSGEERWTMRVPAQAERDSDLVIDAALSDVPALVAEVRRLRRREAELERIAAVNHGLYRSAEADVDYEGAAARFRAAWDETDGRPSAVFGHEGEPSAHVETVHAAIQAHVAARDRQVAAAALRWAHQRLGGPALGLLTEQASTDHPRAADLMRHIAGELEVPTDDR